MLFYFTNLMDVLYEKNKQVKEYPLLGTFTIEKN